MKVRHTITKKGDEAFSSVAELDGKPWLSEECTRAAAKAQAAAK